MAQQCRLCGRDMGPIDIPFFLSVAETCEAVSRCPKSIRMSSMKYHFPLVLCDSSASSTGGFDFLIIMKSVVRSYH